MAVRIAICLSLCFLVVQPLWATHFHAGEIAYEHVSGSTYRVIVKTWTKISSPADRSELEVNFGNGVIDTVQRTSIIFLPISGVCSDLQLNVYDTIQSYPAPGFYRISATDINRNDGIMNIANSVNEPICLVADLIVSPLGPNNSAVFLQSPRNTWVDQSTFHHFPEAFDPDGDSLSFELVTPLGLLCTEIQGYVHPHQTGGAGNTYSYMDSSGLFHWYWPMIIGQYTIAIKVTEWRNGTIAGSVTRDMLLCISWQDIGTGSGPSQMIDQLRLNEIGVRQFYLQGSSCKNGCSVQIHDSSGRMIFFELVKNYQVIKLDRAASGLYTFNILNGADRTIMRRLLR